MVQHRLSVIIVPQVSDTMSDSTASSTTANDLDLIYLKGIMESPLVWHTGTHRYEKHKKIICVFLFVFGHATFA